jgi:hypothetical protein
MCGIFGFSGPRPVDETKLRWLAVENQSRGHDSTGVYGNHLHKDNVTAKNFIRTKGFKAAVKGACTVEGHTRQATHGAKTMVNSHPFAYGFNNKGEVDFNDPFFCVGAHNGFIIPEMLAYHTADLGFKESFEVDSQLIFAALALHKDVNVISRIEGAMAISFMFPNKSKDHLYLYKRKETRCLHIGQHTDGLYYSSEYEPLVLIGCHTVWEAEPDVLYTLCKGQIVDAYNMPKPVLKSLSSNVQRLSWRTGHPSVEINALPESVTIPNRQRASSSTTRGMGFDHLGGDNNNYSNIAENRNKILSNYAASGGHQTNEDGVNARFLSMIRSIQNDIKNVNAEPIDFRNTDTYSSDDMSSCLLTVVLENMETKKPLPAWSVMAEDSIDIAGFTSLNGFTLMKVPSQLCGQNLKFFVYDPIETFGPFEFIINPMAGRVMEVTLSIPFREETTKTKESKTRTNNQLYSDTSGDERGSTQYHLYDDGSGIQSVYKSPEGSNNNILRTQSAKVLGGHQRPQIAGPQPQKGYTNGVVPETELADKYDPEVMKRKLIPSMDSDGEQRLLLDYILDQDQHGKYMNVTIPSITWTTTIGHSSYATWYSIYRTLYKNNMDVHKLFTHASRLLCWDRMKHKCWYKLFYYVECLLIVRPYCYLNVMLCNQPNHKREEYYPSFLIADGCLDSYNLPETKAKKAKTYNVNTFEPETLPIVKKNSILGEDNVYDFSKSRNIGWRYYRDLLKYLMTNKLPSMDTATLTKFAEELRKYKSHVNGIVGNLNKALQESENKSSAEVSELRSVAIQARNFLKSERGDIEDCLGGVEFELGERTHETGPEIVHSRHPYA